MSQRPWRSPRRVRREGRVSQQRSGPEGGAGAGAARRGGEGGLE